MSGVRTEKTVGGVTHSYVTQNGKVVRESYGSKVLDFIYDAGRILNADRGVQL